VAIALFEVGEVKFEDFQAGGCEKFSGILEIELCVWWMERREKNNER